SRRVDLVVAGAGPAGLAAAIHAARSGMSVIVLDPRPAPIDKACGEGIMPGGVEELDALDVRPSGVSFHGVRYADAAEPDLYALGTFRDGDGLGVRRTVLQAALRDRAAACGVVIEQRRLASFD